MKPFNFSGELVRLCAVDVEKDTEIMSGWNNTEFQRLLDTGPAQLWTPKQVRTFYEENIGEMHSFVIRALSDDRLLVTGNTVADAVAEHRALAADVPLPDNMRDLPDAYALITLLGLGGLAAIQLAGVLLWRPDALPPASPPAELDLDLADLDPVAGAQALRLVLRHEVPVQQRPVGRAGVGEQVRVAVAADHRVVARRLLVHQLDGGAAGPADGRFLSQFEFTAFAAYPR